MLFVNVPIGIATVLAAPRVLAETPGQRGRFDLPGAVTGTGGLAALVYGLSNAATSPARRAAPTGSAAPRAARADPSPPETDAGQLADVRCPVPPQASY